MSIGLSVGVERDLPAASAQINLIAKRAKFGSNEFRGVAPLVVAGKTDLLPAERLEMLSKRPVYNMAAFVWGALQKTDHSTSGLSCSFDRYSSLLLTLFPCFLSLGEKRSIQ